MTSSIHSKGPLIIVDDDYDDHFIFNEICNRLHVENDLKVLDAKKNKLLASAQGETSPKEHQEFEQENSYDMINPTK